MDYQKFIDNHWTVFMEHICQFHKIEVAILETYEYELNWDKISQNRNIQWNKALLERFEDRFLWHELAWNESIHWSTEWIEQFKKRLDWYYLGRNTKLPIDKNFIKYHKKNIFIVEDNIYLTPELIQLYGKNLLPKRNIKPEYLSQKELNK